MRKRSGAAAGRGRATARPRTLAIDVGGTGLKASVLDARGVRITERLRVPTPAEAPPKVLVDALVELVAPLGAFERVSIGFPGVVRDGRVLTAPHFGTKRWHRFDLAGALAKRFGKPVRLINDAEMQGLAVVRGTGLELVVTLGTGVGTALFRDGELMPHLELAHHPVRGRKTYNDYLGDRARKKTGARRWNRRVRHVMDILHTLLNYDRVYIGGGNARRVTFDLDRNMRLVSNDAGVLGGIALWKRPPAASR